MTIADIIRQIAKNNQGSFVLMAEVMSVDANAGTCILKPLDELPEFPDARLQAVVGAAGGMLLIPATGSQVLAICYDGVNAVILAYSELEQASLVNTPFSHTVGNNDLRETMLKLTDTLDALVDDLTKLTVTCTAPGSPSSVPLNIASILSRKTALVQVNTSLKALFK